MRAGHYSAHAQFCPLKPVLQFFSSVTQKTAEYPARKIFLVGKYVYTRWKIVEDDPVTSTVDMTKLKIRAFTGLKSDAPAYRVSPTTGSDAAYERYFSATSARKAGDLAKRWRSRFRLAFLTGQPSVPYYSSIILMLWITYYSLQLEDRRQISVARVTVYSWVCLSVTSHLWSVCPS